MPWWGVLFVLVAASPALVAGWLVFRMARVSSLYAHVQARGVEAMGTVRVVERTSMRFNRKRLVHVQLVVHPASGPSYDAQTRCFLDGDIAVVLSIADRGERVPVLVRADDPSRVILDARRERLVREGLAQPSAVEYR